MNGYVAFFNGKRVELYAATKWAAVEAARLQLKVPKSKYGLLAVELAEIDGRHITHIATE